MKHDYAAAIERIKELEFTPEYDTIHHALRFAEKMMSIPSTKMCDAGSEQFPTITNGEEYAAETIFKSMRDQALKELGE